ncbi:MAG TPA: NUDIX domain-containing protein [Bacillota bacterium]|nr:NUDIX domain-containing protein [Bacillota bacterium]HPF42953.1 NUDIX domain-containing protein [Bacillota bacterium]HPJ86389.1 NUDIX domain-containing protein [Bacillota bacterium]HPQ62290.1 NUDIX domain-containing protein [Bacillota bacterium]HRX92054.1 NUDIX domain-containing protein [Candidatus Izemoplasmatales bacterium]
MKRIIFKIYRQPDINLSGSTLHRFAFRGIIWFGDKLLMIQSKKYGEMKFPGGGKEKGEKTLKTLRREVLEETGYVIKPHPRYFGHTIEYARDYKGEYDVFKQESGYYFCEVYPENKGTAYSSGETAYGYHPILVTLDEAIKNNENVQSNDIIPWKERDTKMLYTLKEMQNAD